MTEQQETKINRLTPEQQKKVWQAIGQAEKEDDREPNEVIKDTYDGDVDRYLFDMATWLKVELD